MLGTCFYGFSLLSRLQVVINGNDFISFPIIYFSFVAIGDDRNVYIYMLSPGAPSGHSFGSKHTANRENWTRKFLLQGHSMDVIDLSWSPSVHFEVSGAKESEHFVLASGSIDNNVILWSVPCRSNSAAPAHSTGVGGYSNTILTPTQILRGHTSFVKGVAFDPVGRYLASVSADNLLIIWENSKYSTSGSTTATNNNLNGSGGGGDGGDSRKSLSASTLSFLASRLC